MGVSASVGASSQTTSASQPSMVPSFTEEAPRSTAAARKPPIRPSGVPSSAYRARSPTSSSSLSAVTVACAHRAARSPPAPSRSSAMPAGSRIPADRPSPGVIAVSMVWKQASRSTGCTWQSAAPSPMPGVGRISDSASPGPVHTSSIARNAGP